MLFTFDAVLQNGEAAWCGCGFDALRCHGGFLVGRITTI